MKCEQNTHEFEYREQATHLSCLFSLVLLPCLVISSCTLLLLLVAADGQARASRLLQVLQGALCWPACSFQGHISALTLASTGTTHGGWDLGVLWRAAVLLKPPLQLLLLTRDTSVTELL
jgi:hypothetical protein